MWRPSCEKVSGISRQGGLYRGGYRGLYQGRHGGLPLQNPRTAGWVPAWDLQLEEMICLSECEPLGGTMI